MTVSPANRAALRRHAETCAEARDWTGAIDAFERLRALSPNDADVLLQLSYMHSLAGHYRQARSFAIDANALKPARPEIVKELVARLRTFNEGAALLECAQRMKPLDRVPIPVLLAIAAQLSYLNLAERAMPFLDEARRADPDYPPTLLSRAQVLIYLGRFAEAATDLDRCERRAPGVPQLYWLRSTLKGGQNDERLAPKIVEALQRAGLSAEDQATLGFALHTELDRIGDYGRAWQALEFACRAKRSTLAYRPADTEALVSSLMQVNALGGGPTLSTSKSGRIPVFITGMHRSGTTLLEQLLAGHPNVHGVGELYVFHQRDAVCDGSPLSRRHRRDAGRTRA
ncbi:tetratricopeptide (TPR) repeat protein [Lysobacter sp. HA35]